MIEKEPKLNPNCDNSKLKKIRAGFNWDTEDAIDWKKNAIKMQEVHMRDNSRTEWFSYSREERDAIELRILIPLFGIRLPTTEKIKGSPSCLLKTYTRDQRLHARKLKKVIIEKSNYSEKICFNVIYISHATLNDKDELVASEEPVFIVKGSRKPVDRNARAYSDFNDYIENNDLSRGGMIYPEGGTYTPPPPPSEKPPPPPSERPPPPPSEKPQPSESHSSQFSESESFGNRGDNRPTVNLIADESPNSKFFARVKVITDTVATIAGVALTVTGLILMAPVSVFSAATLSAISTGSFYVGTALTIYSVGSSLHSISVKVNRDESIATEVLTLLSAFFSFYTQQVSQTMVAGAHAGKTYEEAIKGLKYMRLQEKLFPYIKLITAFSSIAGLCTSFYQLWHKKERTIHDYFQFSVLLFMTANTLTKPITLKGIFESQQIKYLKNMKNELTESESKNEFDKMLEVHDTSDEKAYMIRNLNQIENKNEFFELINRNGSFVRCTADGLNIDHEIDLHPKAYNAIGKDVINSKINVIEQTTKAALKKSLKSVAGIDLTENSEVDTLLEKIVNGPIEHREEAVKSLLQKYNIDQKSWDNAMNTFNKTLDDEVTRLITNMKSGASGEEQNLGRLKELGLKQIKGELSMDEKKEMNGVIEKCSFNRKNQFFETTADRRMMMDEYESKISGGKNVEQYRADLRELDRKKDSITENSYNIQKEDINNKLEAAKMAREFREKIDANFAINKSSSEAFVKEYTEAKEGQLKAALENAKQQQNYDAIKKAESDLETFKNIKFEIPTNVSEVIKFEESIKSFNNGQNERLCYRIDVEKTKINLKNIYGPDYENIQINNQKIFENMSLGEYDRLNRVLNTYGKNKDDVMKAAIKISQENDFSEHVKSANDLACLSEAIVQAKNDKKLKSAKATDYYKSLASGEGENFNELKATLQTNLEKVKNLPPNLQAQFSSTLSIMYHYSKHKADFGDNITLDQYVGEYANSIFDKSNLSASTFSQTGNIRQTYAQSFGSRRHLGFTAGSSEIRLSHYAVDI